MAKKGTRGIMIPSHNLRHQPTRSDTAQSQQVGHPHGRMVAIAHMLPRPPGSSWKLALTRDAHSEADDGGGAIDEPATEQFIGRRDPNRWSRPAGRGRTRPSSIPVCLRQPRAGRDRHHRSRHCRADHLGQRGDLRQHQSRQWVVQPRRARPQPGGQLAETAERRGCPLHHQHGRCRRPDDHHRSDRSHRYRAMAITHAAAPACHRNGRLIADRRRQGSRRSLTTSRDLRGAAVRDITFLSQRPRSQQHRRRLPPPAPPDHTAVAHHVARSHLVWFSTIDLTRVSSAITGSPTSSPAQRRTVPSRRPRSHQN